MMFNFILGLNFLRRNKMYTNPKVKQVPSVLNAGGWFMKSKRQEKANQFNSRGSLVDISRFEFFNYLIKISHEIWSHYNTEFRPYNTLPTKVQRSNRNRAKLGRALHKLRSSFAVNPRYKFHHFFEPCYYCSFLQNLLINYREFTDYWIKLWFHSRKPDHFSIGSHCEHSVENKRIL